MSSLKNLWSAARHLRSSLTLDSNESNAHGTGTGLSESLNARRIDNEPMGYDAMSFRSGQS